MLEWACGFFLALGIMMGIGIKIVVIVMNQNEDKSWKSTNGTDIKAVESLGPAWRSPA